MLLLGLLPTCNEPADPSGDAEPVLGTVQQALDGGSTQASAELHEFSLELPAGIAPEEVAATALETLDLRDRIRLESESGDALATSTLGNVLLGNDANVESMVSGGNVSLGDRSTATGSVLATGTITKGNQTVILGDEVDGATTTPHSTLNWDVIVPPPLEGDQMLEPDTRQALAPASYGSLSIKSRAKLYLRTGSYFASSLSIEPDAELVVDDQAGPVVLYVQDYLSFKGRIGGTQDTLPQLLVVYTGSATTFIEASFLGTIVAALWQLCAGTSLAEVVGPPPDADLRLDRTTCTACPPGQISDPQGNCVACPANTVVEGNTCAGCDPNTGIIDAGQCCGFDRDVDVAALDPATNQRGCDPTASLGDCGIRTLHASHLDAYLDGGRSGQVVFKILSTAGDACVGQTLEIDVFQRDASGNWAPWATLIGTGQLGPGGACVFNPPLEIPVPDTAITGGLTDVLAVGRTLDTPAQPFIVTMDPQFTPLWACGDIE